MEKTAFLNQYRFIRVTNRLRRQETFPTKSNNLIETVRKSGLNVMMAETVGVLIN